MVTYQEERPAYAGKQGAGSLLVGGAHHGAALQTFSMFMLNPFPTKNPGHANRATATTGSFNTRAMAHRDTLINYAHFTISQMIMQGEV